MTFFPATLATLVVHQIMDSRQRMLFIVVCLVMDVSPVIFIVFVSLLTAPTFNEFFIEAAKLRNAASCYY